MSFRTRGGRFPARLLPGITLGLAAAALLACLPSDAAAQIHPPAPGVDIPQAYYDRIANDRTAFQFRRAWFGATERARETRRLLDIGVLTSAAATATTVSGTRTVPVIAGKFLNTASDPFTTAELQDQLFDGPNPTGTVTDFYNEISYGMINLTGFVYPQAGGLIQVSQNDTYYEGTQNGLGSDSKVGEYLKELLDATDPTVDFGQFDNDGPDGIPNSGDDDGYVDFAAFVQPEPGGECGTSNLWSHRWVYEGWWGAPYSTNDPSANGGVIKVSDYTIQPMVSCDGVTIIEIGVYAHEFGHAFGLPDLYDTNTANGTSAGVGTFCLMGSGSWGGDSAHPERPAHMSAWCKEQLGWVTPTVLCGDATGLSLADVETSGEVVKVYPHGLLDSEYFLIENRTQTGYDQYLYTNGLAIWHIDNDQPGNGDETHKLVDLEEADGLAQMDANVNRGDAGDLFPGSTSKTLFTDTTNPNAKDYAGLATGLAVTAIDANANPRGFDIALTDCRLALGDVTVNDFPSGNNNGVLDSYERVNLGICLRNDFAGDRTGIQGTLVSLTAGVTVLSSGVTYGTVNASAPNCGLGEYVIESTGALTPGSVVNLRLDLTGDAGYASSLDIALGTGHFVLIVEDDGSANNDALFQNPVTNAGYAWVHHDVGASGTPTLGQLQGALAVVWYVGSEYDNTLTPAEQAVLTDYLAGGGSLFITGQDIGYDLWSQGSAADNAFYQTWLHADFLNDSSGSASVTGVTGDPIGNGVSFTLSGTLGSDLWPDWISGRAGASDVFRYPSSRVGAIRYAGTERLVYFGFDFERIGTPSTRNTVMSRVLDWLIAGDITPPTATLVSPVGGESFSSCDTVNVQWTATDDVGVVEVDLEVSDDGGATWQPIVSGIANTGSYLWPVAPLSGNNFKVKVKARDAAALQGVDWSASAFTLADLQAPALAVTAPNGGESFAVNDPFVIAWSAADDCAGVDSSRVWLSVDNGQNWAFLATVVAPDTSLAWNAPATPSDSCLVRVQAFDGAGNDSIDVSDALFAITAAITGVGDAPGGFTRPALLQNHPNPFGLATRFAFYLPEEAEATLRVFDLSGALVRTVADGVFAPGFHDAVWNGLSDAGRPVGAGIYFYVLETGGERTVRKLVVAR